MDESIAVFAENTIFECLTTWFVENVELAPTILKDLIQLIAAGFFSS